MNAYQLIKLAAFQANAVRQDGTLAPFFTEPELLSWLNDGNLEIEKLLRSIFDDWFVVVMNSLTGTVPHKILGIDYTPSVSLHVPALTPRILLPPDFETLRYIRCVTPGYEFMEYESKDMGDRIFQEYLRVPATYTVPPGGRVFYDVIGERTLFMAPMITAETDIEIAYVARTHRLTTYNTGTVSCAAGATSLVGAGTVWNGGSNLDSDYMDIMFGAGTFASVNPSWNYDGVNLARVKSIIGDTDLTIASMKVSALPALSTYVMASVPAIPPEHHGALADYVTAQMFGKAGNQSQYDRYFNKYDMRKKSILNTVNLRQPDMSFVEDYTTWS